jgi:hypothetical protein
VGKPKTLVIDLVEAGSAHFITTHVWGGWAEAAAVMFELYHGAPPPPRSCTFTPFDRDDVAAAFVWPPTNEMTRASHGNPLNATEHGAYAVACATVGALEGWKVTGRAHHGSGADLLMLREGDDPNDFVRLEVSGVAAGTGDAGLVALRRRLVVKVNQLGRGDLDRPGVAAVVGFELATVLVSGVQG